jgi:hypothetical protein
LIIIFLSVIISLVLIAIIIIIRKRKLENDRTIVFDKENKQENIRRYKNGVEILPSEYTKEELKQKKLMK